MEIAIRPVFRINAGLDSLLLRNEALELLTFRLFRFWSRTTLRRYLWSAVTLDGEALEYTGQARHLLLGFLLVLSILAPAYLVFDCGTQLLQSDRIALPLLSDLTYAATMLMYGIGEYLALRYRLAHTLWRGIRAGLGGSAVAYGFRYLGWSLVFCLTAGLSAPWACVDLARYRIEHGYWGSFRGRFYGEWRGIFVPWMKVWIPCFGPLVMFVLYAIILAGGDVFALTLELAWIFDHVNDREESGFLYMWAVISLTLLLGYIYFRVCHLRWSINYTSVGALRLSCDLREGLPPSVLRGFGVLSLYVLVAVYLIIDANLGKNGLFADLDYQASVWACLGATLVAAAGGSFIWQRLVVVPLLQNLVAHTVIHNLPAAEAAQQAPERRFHHAEGMWDLSHVNIF